MKRRCYALLSFLVVAAPVTGFAAEQLIPAGSLVQCTVSEPKLSSKTADIGDPVLCQVSHVELYGRSVFPYGSYLEGRFEEYKDPGHLVGKGWMELKFDRMILPPDNVIPVAAKVVYVPKYNVDKQGRIHGKGHAVRDVVEWSIPVLWPIDVLTLPRRGPRPVLKAETRLTLKIMDDFGVPFAQSATYGPSYSPSYGRDGYGFGQRAPMSYQSPAFSAPAPQPISSAYLPPPAPTWRPAPPPVTVLVMRDGNARLASNYWFDGPQVRYVSTNGNSMVLPMEFLDLAGTVEANRRRGVIFAMRYAPNQ